MAHDLIVNYGLYRQFDHYVPHLASKEEMNSFHSMPYIDFIEKYNNIIDYDIDILPNNCQNYIVNIGETDCPIYTGMYNYAQIACGASIDSANIINNNLADICINWSGGLHHAKKSEAAGFCYMNDIVLSILELLKYHNRVLYIDIDVHHGDGVEEAFYLTDRVMTVSFHKFGDFFPGTGDLQDIGEGNGKFYCLNVPLNSGIKNDEYFNLFKIVI